MTRAKGISYFTKQDLRGPNYILYPYILERENKEFREAIGVLKSYPDKYTGDLDLPTSIWRDKYKENLFLENDCIHGTNCRRMNNCSCTPDTSKRQLNRHKKKEVARY
jgi:hypothetical protein